MTIYATGLAYKVDTIREHEGNTIVCLSLWRGTQCLAEVEFHSLDAADTWMAVNYPHANRRTAK
ncbi:hypothetical protein G5V57_31440 [Nordella sp. HKS 07]|uniref:hypothetical protein n=1 Tax=Nordella sp. HKS 07 TaxID=2712222 RepID=UPI0013E141A1|nr:hypothetical protein [Nordella sp. HKS 07]QIG51826.1 hypothetical protein G5V57_31440 [Nordella sp. HKS 07]